MFVEVVELIGCFMAGGGASFVAAKLFKLKRANDKCPYGTEPWLWVDHGGSSYGFLCPKCEYTNKNRASHQICECSEYHSLHFHFECADCKYKNIMRTKDDS